MTRWKWIENYEELYKISDEGEVWSYRRRQPKALAQQRNRTGYWYVQISNGVEPGGKVFNVHTLVAHAFLGPRPNGMVIRHLDDDRNNNRVSNLAYGTHSENMRDVSRKKQTSNNGRKRRCPYGHRYVGPNLKLTAIGGRVCAACNATRSQAQREGWTDQGRHTERWRAAADKHYARIMKGFVDPEPDDPMPYGADPEVLTITVTRGTLNAVQRAIQRAAKDNTEPPMKQEWSQRAAKEFYYAEMRAVSLGYKHKWDGVLPSEDQDPAA